MDTLQFGQKHQSNISRSMEKLTSMSINTSRHLGSPSFRRHNETLPRSPKQKRAYSNDFVRQNSLPSVTINDETIAEYKSNDYEWLLINARLEHEIQETQAAASQVKLLQNQLQAEKAARVEAQDLINDLLGQNRELLSHISTLVQQLQNVTIE